MKRHLGFALCLMGTAMLILWGILWSVEYVGTDARLYHKLQMKAGILEFAGISEDELIRLDEALSKCLMGDGEILSSLETEVFGKKQPAFNERELTHMEDCRKLFALAGQVKTFSKACGVFAVAAGFILLKNKRRINRACRLGPLALVIPLGILAAWAIVDFNAAFNFFHEMLFTNDLWLLDPRTDLLIRICPQSMFMNMGMRIGVMSLIFALAIPLAMTIITAAFSKRKLIDNGDVK